MKLKSLTRKFLIAAASLTILGSSGLMPSVTVAQAATLQVADGEAIYVVQPGDTLSAIAVRYGTTVNTFEEVSMLGADGVDFSLCYGNAHLVASLLPKHTKPFGNAEFRASHWRKPANPSCIKLASASHTRAANRQGRNESATHWSLSHGKVRVNLTSARQG